MAYLALSNKLDPRYYPDLLERGGLPASLRQALDEAGGGLEVTSGLKFIPDAVVAHGPRGCHVFLAGGRRLFLADFWSGGCVWGEVWSDDLAIVARAIRRWIIDELTVEGMKSRCGLVPSTEAGRSLPGDRPSPVSESPGASGAYLVNRDASPATGEG